MRPMPLAALALLCFVLSACGGGGGGSEGSPGGAANGFNVSLGRSAITFDYVEGIVPAAAVVPASWTGTPPDPVYVGAVVEGNAINPNIPVLISSTGASASISPRSGLAPGEYTGRVLFLVCADQACNNRIGGSPLPISYSVRVRPPLFTPVQGYSFDYTVGSALPPSRTINIAANDWTATVSAPWLQLSATSGAAPQALTLSLNPQGVPAGTFNATVTVTSAGISQVANVAVIVRVPALVASSGQLAFNAFTGQVPAAQALTISTQNSLATAWTATTNVPWINLSANSGTTPATISVATPGVLTMPSGGYSGEITFTSTIAGTTVSARAQVNLTLQRPALNFSTASLAFAAVNGASIPAKPVAVTSSAPDGIVALAVSDNAPWLSVDMPTGTAPGTFNFSANPAIGPLASGQYQGIVQFSAAAGVDTWTVDVPVSLALTPAVLTASPASIELGGDTGRTFDTVPLTLTANTGASNYAWSASQSGAGSWLQATTSGSVSAVSSNNVMLKPLRDGVQPGTHSKNLTFTAQVNGDTLTKTVPVTFNLDTHRLLALENGIAFSSTPQFSRLSRAIPIVSNFDLPIAWQASSNQSWLAVTASGVGGGNIVLTADPAALATDQLYTGTVTISATGSDHAEPESIRVGLWKGSTTPATRQTITGTNFRHAFADPIRPFVHVNERDSVVRTFNVYTGQEVLPAITLPTTMAWAMTANTDGSTLWVTAVQEGKLIPVDIDSRTVLTSKIITLADVGSGQSLALTYARPNGVGMVLPGASDAYSVEGERLGPFSLGHASVAADGKKVFTANFRWDIDYTSAHGGRYTRDTVSGVPVGGGIDEEVATNLDGSRVYFPATNDQNIAVYDGNLFTLLTPLSPPGPVRLNNLDVARDGRVAVGGESIFTPENLWLYRADGSLITTFQNANGVNNYLEPRVIVFSSDGHFIVVPAGNVQIYPAGQ